MWKLCDNLRDGGVSYQNYVNELASLLFLKMCKETGQEADYLPEGYRWDDLKSRIGQEQMQFYRNLLVQLGADEKKLVQAVFHNVSTTMTQPKQLTELVSIWTHWTGTMATTVSPAMTSAICTKGCCRRTPTKPNPARASTLPRVR
jgi:type I restriction-modification system DNA methylase subunit